MLGFSLGRRFERLLFFAAPISLLSFLVLLMAIATTSQRDRLDGRCLELAAKAIDRDQGLVLFKAWLAYTYAAPPKHITKEKYQAAVIAAANEASGIGCRRIVESAELEDAEPSKIAEALHSKADKLSNSAIVPFWGRAA